MIQEDASAADQKRRDVLLAAKRRFLEDGYSATGMEAVARDAGVSTATLYSFFPGKGALFGAVVDATSLRFAEMVQTRIGGLKDGRSRLQAFARVYAEFMADPFVRSVFRLLAAEGRRFGTATAQFAERLRSGFGGVLLDIITAMRSEGQLSELKPSWAAGQLMGMIEHPTFLLSLVIGPDVTTRRSLEAIADDAVVTFLSRYGSGEQALCAPEPGPGVPIKDQTIVQSERAVTPKLHS